MAWKDEDTEEQYHRAFGVLVPLSIPGMKIMAMIEWNLLDTPSQSLFEE